MQQVLDKLSSEDQKIIEDHIRSVIFRQTLIMIFVAALTLKWLGII